jgi:hypothetical protein
MGVNAFNPRVTILDFWQCRLLNLTTYFGKNLKKHCSAGYNEQLFFKYFPIRTLIFEKMGADVVCSSLTVNEAT